MTEQAASSRNPLTALQQRLIQDGRSKGIGYKAIATKLGLSRDTVRNYCRIHNMGGYADAQAAEKREQRDAQCSNCGKPLTQPHTGRRRKFCSDACRRAWWLAHSDAIQKRESALYPTTCACCGKMFSAYGNRNRRFCGHGCYIQNRFHRSELS